MNFSNVRYLSFDCYGTLVDWENGILSALSPMFEGYCQIDPIDVLRSFARWESKFESDAFENYHSVLTRVQQSLEKDFLKQNENPACLADSVSKWLPFPDSTKALRTLQADYQLVILSNVDKEMFRATEKKLEINFDFIFTAEEIGSYKPSTANFEFMLDRLACEKNEILHVAQSLYHDHVPAKSLGLHSVHVNRPSRIPGQGVALPADVAPDHVVTSMSELADWITSNS